MSGKYTFCKFGFELIELLKVTDVPADAGVGKEVNLIHCKEVHAEKALWKLVQILTLGIVIFLIVGQFENEFTKVVQLFNDVGNVTLLKFLQLEKDVLKLVIAVEFEGNIISNNLSQLKKVVLKSVNELAEVGITITYKFAQPWNIDDNWVVQETVEGSFTYSNNWKFAFPIVELYDKK